MAEGFEIEYANTGSREELDDLTQKMEQADRYKQENERPQVIFDPICAGDTAEERELVEYEEEEQIPGVTYLDMRNTREYNNVLVDFSAIFDLPGAREALDIAPGQSCDDMERLLTVGKPRVGAKESIMRLLKASNVYFYVCSEVFLNAPLPKLADWIDNLFGIDWQLGNRLIARVCAYWDDDPLRAACCIAFNPYCQHPECYAVMLPGIRHKADSMNTWEEVEQYVIKNVLSSSDKI